MFIKLRSQCNAEPLLLLGAAASGRVLFLMRHANEWALSRHRAFGEGAGHIAGILRQTMDALETVIRAGIPCDVVWFEALVRDPVAVLQVCAPGVRPDPVAVAAVMARDSQGYTILARQVVAGGTVAQGFLLDFAAHWAGECATANWGERTRQLINDVWKEQERL